jgi:hypothetical protein
MLKRVTFPFMYLLLIYKDIFRIDILWSISPPEQVRVYGSLVPSICCAALSKV